VWREILVIKLRNIFARTGARKKENSVGTELQNGGKLSKKER
jgi:hypothetical protein